MKVVLTRDATLAQPLAQRLGSYGYQVTVVPLTIACPRNEALEVFPETTAIVGSVNVFRCLSRNGLNQLGKAKKLVIAGPHTYEEAIKLGFQEVVYAGEKAEDIINYFRECEAKPPEVLHVRGEITRLEPSSVTEIGINYRSAQVYSVVPAQDWEEKVKSIAFSDADTAVLVFSRHVGGLIAEYLQRESFQVGCIFLVNSEDLLKDFQSRGLFARMCKLWEYDTVLKQLQILGERKRA